ncbi:hypothetical protein BYT27DRAFT_7336318 [Phlegmacium glaucopus]|nr:hypothetical protein BYT27DRAFT_7336318 [Phlegmacium glaucopus]
MSSRLQLHESEIHARFYPQILGESTTRAYLLNIQGSSQVIDIVAYGGYKFVGVILTLAVGFMGVTGVLWTIVFIYAFLSNAFFLLRSLRSVVLPGASSVPRTTYSRNRDPQLIPAPSPYRLFVLGGRHADPLYGMVSMDIIMEKQNLAVFF